MVKLKPRKESFDCDSGDEKEIILNKKLQKVNSTIPKSLAEQTGQKDESEVTLQLTSYLDLFKQSKEIEKSSIAPKFVIPVMKIDAQTSDDCCLVQYDFEINVISNKWTPVQLFPSTSSVYDVKIEVISQQKDDNKDTTIFSKGTFGLHKNDHTFFSQHAGIYKVICSLEYPYTNDNRTSVNLSLPLTSYGELKFSIPDSANCQITANPTLSHEIQHLNDSTILTAIFSAVPQLTIQWTKLVVAKNITETEQKEEEEEEENNKAKVEEKIVTAQQETLYSVGEGLLSIDSTFSYKLVHTSRSVFSIVLPENLRILQVEGENIKKWRIATDKVDSEIEDETEIHVHRPQKVLYVELKFAVMDSYEFSVTMELDNGETSIKKMELPVIWCNDVTREKGYILLDTKSNIEVEEVSVRGVTPVDISELPSSLTELSSNPLSAYKTLLPKNTSIVVNITKHQDTDVLIATIENGHFEITVAEDGQLLHRMSLTVRNTQQQYLRAKLPKGFSIWSTVTNDKPIKPAIDDTGRVMIPLEKSLGDQNQKSFTIQLIFLVQVEKMENSGILNLEFGSVDIPINILNVTIRVPQRFSYGSFTGNLRQNKKTFRGRQKHNHHNHYNYNTTSSTVSFPIVGEEFSFQKLLVSEEAQYLKVPYKTPLCLIL